MPRHRVLLRAGLALFLLAWLLRLSVAQGGQTQLGNSWQPLAGPPGGSVGNVSLSPNFATDHTLYAAAGRSGVYRSTDGGASWAIVGAGILCGS
jgi:hypothetical protein